MSFWDQPAPAADGPPEPDAVVIRPAPKLSTPEPLYAFFARQGIDRETVNAFKCGISTHEFSALGNRPAICFPFRDAEGQLLGYGYRPPEGQPREWDHAAAGSLFNLDAVETWDAIWWCADEIEAMALVEIGFRQTVAAPCDLDTAIRSVADKMEAVTRVTLVLPATPEGEKLTDLLANRFGRHRVWTVAWPDGCACACDVLRLHGPERLERVIHAALPWPIEGVQYAEPGLLQKLRKMKPPPVLTTGTAATDAVMRFPGEGRLIIVTGYPGGGKTTVMRWVMVHLAREHDRRWLCFSPENAPWQRFLAECAEVYVGKPFWRRRMPNGDWANPMPDDELAGAEDWLGPRIRMLVADSVDEPPSLDWILDRAAKCALRDGCTDLLIDPWNEVEHSRSERMTETEYVGASLQKINAFCARHAMNVWVIAHPKSPLVPKTGKLPPPSLHDISGGANWANKAAMGLAVHTPDNEFTQIIVLKTKFRRWGAKGAKALVSFDPSNNRYYSTQSQAGMGQTVEEER